ncbi:MAG: hypothetical protein ACXQTR_01620 [Candidatus Methanospirareceae archaeon]
MKKHVSSFERFLSEHKWSMHQVIVSLISLLLTQLADKLMVHGASLLAEDTTFASLSPCFKKICDEYEPIFRIVA